RPPRLSWKLRVEVSLRARWTVVVDARSGAVLDRFSEVMEQNVAGVGTDANGDRRALNVWSENGLFYLVDTSKPMYDPTSDPPDPSATRGGIVVLDAAHQPPTSSPEEIPDLLYITATRPSGWRVPDGVSAAFALSNIYDYYRERHGR